MKKLDRQKVLAVILVAPLALITICAVLFLAFTYHKQSGTSKLLMPGNYEVTLEPRRLYVVWYFWQWPSKDIREKFTGPIINIRTSSQSNIERFKSSYTDAQQFFNNVGRAEFSIKAEKPCTVTVTVDQRGVVILAPIDSHIYFPEANFFSFYGAADDSHFVPKGLP